MAVRAATTRTVPGTTASSCQSGGMRRRVGVDGGDQCDASRDAEDGAGERGKHLRRRESRADLLRGRAERARERR